MEITQENINNETTSKGEVSANFTVSDTLASLHEKLERKSSKVRLSKQVEVEYLEESERSLATKFEGNSTHCTEDDQSPNSDESDQTVVSTGLFVVLSCFE